MTVVEIAILIREACRTDLTRRSTIAAAFTFLRVWGKSVPIPRGLDDRPKIPADPSKRSTGAGRTSGFASYRSKAAIPLDTKSRPRTQRPGNANAGCEIENRCRENESA